MAFAAIKIEECAVHESRFRDGDKYWLATQLIEQAKDRLWWKFPFVPSLLEAKYGNLSSRHTSLRAT